LPLPVAAGAVPGRGAADGEVAGVDAAPLPDFGAVWAFVGCGVKFAASAAISMSNENAFDVVYSFGTRPSQK
jgi:hypothetical protein